MVNKGIIYSDDYKKPLLARILYGFLFVAIIFISSFEIAYFDFLTIGPERTILAGNRITLPQVKAESVLPQLSAIVRIKSDDAAFAISNIDSFTPLDFDDDYQLNLNIANVIPVKSLDVKVLSSPDLIVGGHSIGILLQTEGVTVVGHSPVILKNGEAAYPAKEAGIESGDFITEINGEKVTTNTEVADIINEAGENGQALKVKYLREQTLMETVIHPQFCFDTHTYRAGMYVRDNTAGVGTMTFYDPESNVYGALGHMVSDLNNQDNDSNGIIVRADIQGIKASRKGSPGEKMGVFVGGNWQGTIDMNTTYGIFGKMKYEIENEFYPSPLKIALEEDVKVGAAEICTVIDGERIESYSINILKLLPNYRSSGKGMIIEVTDPELLAETGGIVQGMSGSPIIQDGCLVGAVTHVFVNQPEKGYACFAEWMLDEAGLLD